MKVTGKTAYGQTIGVLMLDTAFPRIRGDIGNAGTFSFPVKYKIVKNAVPLKVVENYGEGLLPDFLAGARELEAAGVRALTTSCGFLAVFQRELAAAVNIPVFSSSLLQIPLIETMLGAQKHIVVVTANSAALSARHFRGAGVAPERLRIVGLQDKAAFYSIFVSQTGELALNKVQAELETVAGRIKNDFPAAGAIVLECTNLPPFRRIFQRITGLPVFDIVTLANYIHSSVVDNLFGEVEPQHAIVKEKRCDG